MAKTFGDMKTRIVDETLRDDLQTQIHRAILSAIDYFSLQEWAQGQKSGTLTVGNAVATYTLPTDFLEMLHCEVLATSTSRQEVCEITYQEMRRLNDSVPPVYSAPEKFAIFGDSIEFWPVDAASVTKTVTLYYQYKIPAPEAETDGDTGSASYFWMNTAEPMIRAYAKALLFAEVIRDTDAAQADFAIAEQFRKQLVTHSESKSTSGQIVGWY